MILKVFYNPNDSTNSELKGKQDTANSSPIFVGFITLLSKFNTQLSFKGILFLNEFQTMS